MPVPFLCLAVLSWEAEGPVTEKLPSWPWETLWGAAGFEWQVGSLATDCTEHEDFGGELLQTSRWYRWVENTLNVSQNAVGGDLGHREGICTNPGGLEWVFLGAGYNQPKSASSSSLWTICCLFSTPEPHPCLRGMTRLMALHPCAEVRGCMLMLTGWGRTIHCVGLTTTFFMSGKARSSNKCLCGDRMKGLHNFFFILT